MVVKKRRNYDNTNDTTKQVIASELMKGANYYIVHESKNQKIVSADQLASFINYREGRVKFATGILIEPIDSNPIHLPYPMASAEKIIIADVENPEIEVTFDQTVKNLPEIVKRIELNKVSNKNLPGFKSEDYILEDMHVKNLQLCKESSCAEVYIHFGYYDSLQYIPKTITSLFTLSETLIGTFEFLPEFADDFLIERVQPGLGDDYIPKALNILTVKTNKLKIKSDGEFSCKALDIIGEFRNPHEHIYDIAAGLIEAGFEKAAELRISKKLSRS